MSRIIAFGLGMVSGAMIYRYFFKNSFNLKKETKCFQENVYTIAKRIPLIIDNSYVLEYGVNKGEEMFRILDKNDDIIVPSGKIAFYDQTQDDFTITFSNGYILQADKDTIMIVNIKDDTIYESAINYEDLNEMVSKINLGSPVFDKLYDFIQSKL